MKKPLIILTIMLVVTGCTGWQNPLIKQAWQEIDDKPEAARTILAKVHYNSLSESDKAELKKLDGTGKNIEIRMILVPEHNMSETDLRAAGAFLAPRRNISAVRLLAYHSLARSKFRAVGHPDTMPDVPSPDAEALERCAEILRSYSIRVINSLK